MSERTPELTILAVLVALVAGILLLGGRGGAGGGAAASTTEVVSPQRLARVERRVEELRGLRFLTPVKVEVLSPDEVRAIGVRESREATPRAETAAREELMKLLGLIDADVSLDSVTSSIYGEQVAGFYDPRSGRLALVEGAGVDDVTLAHELTHALEDQHYDLDRLGEPGRGDRMDDDAAAGESGLVEGTATALMMRYLQRYPEALTLGDAFGQLLSASGGRALPPYVMRSLLFPYQQGERFVDGLLATSGDWRLVDNALRYRPPVSTAELYDVDRWLKVERPEPVALPAAAAFGPGWRRVLTSTFGEFDLRELLLAADVPRAAAEQLAGGWTGGRYALWRRGPLAADGCAAPCAERDAFVLGLRLDSPVAARAVAAPLRTWARRLAQERGTGAAVQSRGDALRLTLAPGDALAARLAR
ncbi:hypothetical protein [Conexibacter woesei]|uniref:Uncharacterized protein n=1 Tax=Conexibacter woesei (strain DSM 14684 / CCUG 47730 / CIP 108061 / JCM 11494 / NBRC 100937 / ID131577) TaxID=469383 RepID=D3FD25_CONWI|nr:hypothetical protein [Conexibacter woesei]ADB51537.1 conserved hypothetical protein [Conexibacter woesei DSM 14684]